MLFWIQTFFCSNQVLGLRTDTSETSKAVENIGICEKEDIQQRGQKPTQIIEGKNLDGNQSSSILFNYLKYCADKDLNSRHKNVNCDLYNFSSLITKKNNSIPYSLTRSTVTNHVSKKQYCTFKQSRIDITRLKILKSNENDTAKHSYIYTSCSDNINLLLHSTENCLL